MQRKVGKVVCFPVWEQSSVCREAKTGGEERKVLESDWLMLQVLGNLDPVGNGESLRAVGRGGT